MTEEGKQQGESIVEGMRFAFERDVTAEDISLYATLSGDRNALHIDNDYAATTNYGAPIVHGAFQVGLASAMLGMHLPGGDVLLGAINARFPAPLYYPSRVTVAGSIRSWEPKTMTGNLEVVVSDHATNVETARISMTFGRHEIRPGRAGTAEPKPASATSGARRDAILVTGGSGALGSAICRALAHRFDVIAIVHDRPLVDDLADLESVESLSLNVFASMFESDLADALGARVLYGVVHAAWPGAPSGGLLHAPAEILHTQLEAGTGVPLALARQLFARVSSRGGRLIAIGSIAGTHMPHVPKGAYSLGKAALEHAILLVAPELARKGITANVISPAFVAAGINSRATERQQLIEAATIPLGRLCTPADVVNSVEFLLSDAASFVSGQNIVLSGAQL